MPSSHPSLGLSVFFLSFWYKIFACRAVPMTPETRASPGSAGTLLSTVMLLAIIVTTTCQLRTGVARDMRT